MADAVVVPGGRFGPAAGMLTYVAAAAERRGATVHRHAWSRQLPDSFGLAAEGWVRDEITPLLDEAGGRPLLIGKSLGTHAAAVAAERSLPAVWLTPILTVPAITAALGRATAPFLLVGGTADPWWDAEAARRLSPYLLQVEGADHGMFVPGAVTKSIAVLASMVATTESFLDAIGWPR